MTTETTSRDAVLQVRHLLTRFHTSSGLVTAVDDLSLTLHKGETLGLVGESGSGKSVTARSIMGLIDPPGVIEGGEVLLNGTDLRRLTPEQMRRVRGDDMSLVFQNPLTALNPALRVGWQLREGIRAHRKLPKDEVDRRIHAALLTVGIGQPEKRERSYPHAFSGGMRQRVVIAMSVLNEPAVLIADEPTTALDVTIQAQVLDLLKKLVQEQDLALLLITHNMGVVANMCDRIAVMYAGEIVEEGGVLEVFRRPRHPYTQALLRSMPRLDGTEKRLPSIPGTPPSMSREFAGCRFRERCLYAEDVCEQHPELLTVARQQSSRCWVGQRGVSFSETHNPQDAGEK